MFELNFLLPARVVVDPNGASRMDPDLVVARVQDADRLVEPGEFVIAVEPDDDNGVDLVGSACVSHVDVEHGLIYLHVDWESFIEDPAATVDVLVKNIVVHGSVRNRVRPAVGSPVVNGSGVLRPVAV